MDARGRVPPGAAPPGPPHARRQQDVPEGPAADAADQQYPAEGPVPGEEPRRSIPQYRHLMAWSWMASAQNGHRFIRYRVVGPVAPGSRGLSPPPRPWPPDPAAGTARGRIPAEGLRPGRRPW